MTYLEDIRLEGKVAVVHHEDSVTIDLEDIRLKGKVAIIKVMS